MNKDRRKAIAQIVSALEALDLDGIKNDIEVARDEEQDYYDSMPEAFQASDQGDRAQEAVGSLDEAIDALEEIVDQISTAVDALNAASE